MLLTMQNIYVSATNPFEPRMSMLLTKHRLSLPIWLQRTIPC